MDDKEQQKKLSEVEMRHREILKLERSLKELHELFMDLARLVENQVRSKYSTCIIIYYIID